MFDTIYIRKVLYGVLNIRLADNTVVEVILDHMLATEVNRILNRIPERRALDSLQNLMRRSQIDYMLN